MGSTPSQEELARLRLEVWKLRGRRSRLTGTVLFLLGSVLFASAFLTRYIVFEVSAILSLLVGAVLMFTSAEPYVKMRVANSVGISSFKALAELVTNRSSSVKPVFYPVKETDRVSESLVDDTLSSPQWVSDQLEKGRAIPLSGEKLFADIREELETTKLLNWDELLDILPRVLVDGMGLAKSVEIRREAGFVEVRLLDMAFQHFCMDDNVRSLCGRVGCPVNSCIASILAANSNNAVRGEGCTFFHRDKITLLRYNLVEIAADSQGRK